jgi:protein-tyrosine phosphatase
MLSKLKLAGAPNFRDIGGYRARNGMILMDHRVFRSDRFFSLTEEDLNTVEKIGIRTLYDLRSEGERDLHPNRWPDGCAVDEFHGNIVSDIRSSHSSVFEPLRQNPCGSGARAMMMGIYTDMPATFAPLFGSLVNKIGDSKHPVLVHCTAGKDRTGFAIAVLMKILGVHNDDVYAEYLLSAKYRSVNAKDNDINILIKSQIGVTPSDDILEEINGVNPDYLNMAFNRINSHYGSLKDYLKIACRIDDKSIDRMCASVLS